MRQLCVQILGHSTQTFLENRSATVHYALKGFCERSSSLISNMCDIETGKILSQPELKRELTS